MKEHRHARARERKSHLSPDAERLVAAALGLANSGSRTEDRFWEAQLAARIERLLDSGHIQAVYDSLDRLHQTDSEAYGALIEAVEEAAEAASVEVDGQRWDLLLVAAPLVVWTRFRIPAGPLPAEGAQALAAHWQAHVLARNARFRLSPYLYSIDQLPRDFGELRRLTRKLGQSAISGQAAKLDLKTLPETAEMLADSRFLLGVVAVPAGTALFRWQESEPGDHASRVQCLEQWIAQARPNLEPLVPGCGFECLLPDAFHINLRESDRRVRPYSIRAAVHFLTHALGVDPAQISAAVAAFGDDRVDEYRIGLSVGDGDEVAHGIVWPMLGAESEEDDPPPLEQIREVLREVGVTEMRVWPELSEPEFCEDCGVPLYPNGKGEIVHAEMPGDVEPESSHFH
ncbi:MAG TPA: DUF2863 family protein [Burkholderiaceae bacterium]|nr:DUF2863 family protein [Burkholderiaceae bacterium]